VKTHDSPIAFSSPEKIHSPVSHSGIQKQSGLPFIFFISIKGG